MPFDIEPEDNRPDRPTDPLMIAIAAALGHWPTEDEITELERALRRELADE
ncbi:hypothetical protein [Tateyamaria sp. Alg231-49]|uniref:hypothetical protein n=1 Tax=Tateyamaria sp. Alg231-49 TaxID=1922219 RepID=UPI00131F04CF|nr:hypothetical protein [Tateyamaria sp. Alg231-49]